MNETEAAQCLNTTEETVFSIKNNQYYKDEQYLKRIALHCAQAVEILLDIEWHLANKD